MNIRISVTSGKHVGGTKFYNVMTISPLGDQTTKALVYAHYGPIKEGAVMTPAGIGRVEFKEAGEGTFSNAAAARLRKVKEKRGYTFFPEEVMYISGQSQIQRVLGIAMTNEVLARLDLKFDVEKVAEKPAMIEHEEWGAW